MNAPATAEARPPGRGTCPYCGQRVAPRKLGEIRERIRQQEQGRLAVLENQLRERVAADMRGYVEQLAKRGMELARQEHALRQRMKGLEGQAKVRFDEGYRQATVEAQRVQEQLRRQVEEFERWTEGSAGDEPGDRNGQRLRVYVTSDDFKGRIRGILDAVDDLRNLRDEERKRHEGTWCAQEETLRAMEQFAGRIQARVRAIVEGGE